MRSATGPRLPPTWRRACAGASPAPVVRPWRVMASGWLAHATGRADAHRGRWGEARPPGQRSRLGQGAVPRRARRRRRGPDRLAAEPRRPAECGPGRRDRLGRQRVDARDLGPPLRLLSRLDPGRPAGSAAGGCRDRSAGRRSGHGPGADGQRQRSAARPTRVPSDLRCLRRATAPARPAHRWRGCRRLSAGDGRRPSHDVLRVVRLAAPELHGDTS